MQLTSATIFCHLRRCTGCSLIVVEVEGAIIGDILPSIVMLSPFLFPVTVPFNVFFFVDTTRYDHMPLMLLVISVVFSSLISMP